VEKGAAIVKELREGRAVALLAGRLAGLAGSQAMRPAIIEACGGGSPAWADRIAPDLEIVCRYGEEAAAARKAGDAKRAGALEAYVNARARSVLDRLEAESR
jgi:hypothetical protein